MSKNHFYFFILIEVKEDGKYEPYLKKLTFNIKKDYYDVPIEYQHMQHHPEITKLAKYKSFIEETENRIKGRLEKKNSGQGN